MALTTDQVERLEELESSANGMQVKVYLPHLPDESVWKLGQWSERVVEHAPEFGDWLHKIVVEEIYRRASDAPIEARTPILPIGWSNTDLADALAACFGLLESNQDRGLDQFLHKLSAAVVVQARARLRQSGS